MKTADYRLIAADIDGTIVDYSFNLTKRTIAAVKAAVEKGKYFVLSTGRPVQGIKKLVESLSLENMPYILYNGAMVVMNGEPIYSLTIDPEDAVMLVDEGHRRNSTMVCWAQNRLYSETLNDKIDFYKSISGVEPIVVDSLAELAERGITKFVWYDGEQKTLKNYAALKEKFGGRLGVAPSRAEFLEFFNASCSKSTALSTVCKMLGVKREETVAVGDGFNDVDMLEYAALGVAMGNAPNAVKERCGFVADSCENDGLAKFIEEFVLKNR